ncbi:MAG: hypothetical protein HOH36_08475 [Acidimicrobiaceae bacterium]|jgi:hypothetical protein|nr:hypothetical protein [Acidimicrobiaceae bacterium]MBT5581008.1 hypothetical protein [Acidimicrobiaceae bacterium]MBT5850454.1 hypothetical protein [Acidimicrobiaceae bacterium]
MARVIDIFEIERSVMSRAPEFPATPGDAPAMPRTSPTVEYPSYREVISASHDGTDRTPSKTREKIFR